MRLVLASLMLSAAPLAVLAAPAEIPATVSAVTLFPTGAQVTRVLEVPGGEVLVPNLPDGTDITGLRVTGEGVQIGATTLIGARAPASDMAPTPAVTEARARVEALEQALAAKRDAIAQSRAAAVAARAQADVLRHASTQNTAIEDLPRLAQAVGTGVLEATREALKVEAEVRQAEAGLKPDREALERARRALAALEHPDAGADALLISTEGAGRVTITTFVPDAGWAPAYDLALDSAAGRLDIARFVSIHQASGEDWRGVALTLSTARPAGQADPSELWPELVRAGPPDQPRPMASEAMRKADVVMAAAPEPGYVLPEMLGQTLTYRYPAAVDIRDGVEGLRLKLDALEQPVQEIAEAVPLLDETAYRVVEGTNGAEPLLPGPAALYVDGAMVGAVTLPFIAGGDKLRLGMGPIDGLRLKRVVPEASSGGRGVILTSNARQERAEITVENLSGRDWPVRLIDRVPYSEQDELKVSFKAEPQPAATDWNDMRGLLAWEFSLPQGKSQKITLETSLSWPSGQVLQ